MVTGKTTGISLVDDVFPRYREVPSIGLAPKFGEDPAVAAILAEKMGVKWADFTKGKTEISCPEGTIKDKAFVVTCANASQYGYNAHIAPHADIQDGMMNVAILKPLSVRA